jgi:hypothetical protein
MRREDNEDFEEVLAGLDDDNDDVFQNGITYTYELDRRYLNHQMKILKRLSSTNPVAVGQVYNHETDHVGAACWKDYVELYDICCQVGSSISDCDMIIEKFSKMNARRGIGLNVPKTFKAIKTALEKTINEDYTMRTIDVMLNEDLFGSRGIIGSTGYCLNVVEVLSEMLLNVDVRQFHFSPLVQENKSGEQIISIPASSKVFDLAYTNVQESFGKDVFPLCYVISGDDLILNKTGSRKAKPWYVQIANMGKQHYNSDDSIQCIGFSPQSHYTNAELLEKLSPQVPAAGKRDEVLRWCRHKQEFEYLDSVLSDTEMYNKTNRHVLSLQVGSNPEDVFKFVLVQYAIVADNKESQMVAGIQCTCKSNRKCRACNVETEDILDFNGIWENRDAAAVEFLGKRGECFHYMLV